MKATHRVELKLSPLLTTNYRTEHILPHLQYRELISIGQICDHVFTSIFTATHIQVYKQEHLVLEGHQKGVSGYVTSEPNCNIILKTNTNMPICQQTIGVPDQTITVPLLSHHNPQPSQANYHTINQERLLIHTAKLNN